MLRNNSDQIPALQSVQEILPVLPGISATIKNHQGDMDARISEEIKIGVEAADGYYGSADVESRGRLK